jgi:hypothetical protein
LILRALPNLVFLDRSATWDLERIWLSTLKLVSGTKGWIIT